MKIKFPETPKSRPNKISPKYEITKINTATPYKDSKEESTKQEKVVHSPHKSQRLTFIQTKVCIDSGNGYQ